MGDVLEVHGAPADDVLAAAGEAWVLEEFRRSHEDAVRSHQVFGVPTFVQRDRAVFVRLMTRPGDDGPLARATVDRVLRLIDEQPELNEFKHTTIAH